MSDTKGYDEWRPCRMWRRGIDETFWLVIERLRATWSRVMAEHTAAFKRQLLLWQGSLPPRKRRARNPVQPGFINRDDFEVSPWLLLGN
jgi:hypothetical protein